MGKDIKVGYNKRKPGFVRSGICTGANKGHVVTPRAVRVKPSHRLGKLGSRVKVVREVIREVAGFAPYERRIQEILKGGGANPTKRAIRFARGRLGSHQRAKKKLARMNEVIEAMAKAENVRAAAEKAKREAESKE